MSKVRCALGVLLLGVIVAIFTSMTLGTALPSQTGIGFSLLLVSSFVAIAVKPTKATSMALALVVLLSSVMYLYCAALVVYRSTDACMTKIPVMSMVHIDKSYDLLLGAVRCDYQDSNGNSQGSTLVPFSELVRSHRS